LIYSKTEQDLVINKRIFTYYDSNFSLEMTLGVGNVGQKHIFIHKLTASATFRCLISFSS